MSILPYAATTSLTSWAQAAGFDVSAAKAVASPPAFLMSATSASATSLLVVVADRDAGAALAEHRRDAGADAARRGGDDRNLAGERFVHGGSLEMR